MTCFHTFDFKRSTVFQIIIRHGGKRLRAKLICTYSDTKHIVVGGGWNKVVCVCCGVFPTSLTQRPYYIADIHECRAILTRQRYKFVYVAIKS
jgi:hypothetical protein